MNRCLLLIALFYNAIASAFADPLIDLNAIAGKTVSEVDKALGKPSSLETSKYGAKRVYRDGKIEIIFINGKSDWLTINDLQALPFNESAIEALGLRLAPATLKNRDVIRWESYAGLLAVSLFPLNGKVDYAYVKVKTK